MKTLHMSDSKLDLDSVISLAREEPVLILTADGTEFFVSLADDFDQEVTALRRSPTFQRFLDERAASTRRFPLEEIEAEIDRDLAKEGKPNGL